MKRKRATVGAIVPDVNPYAALLVTGEDIPDSIPKSLQTQPTTNPLPNFNARIKTDSSVSSGKVSVIDRECVRSRELEGSRRLKRRNGRRREGTLFKCELAVDIHFFLIILVLTLSTLSYLFWVSTNSDLTHNH